MSADPVARILSEWAADIPTPGSDLASNRALDALTDGLACIFAGCNNPVTLKVLKAAVKSHGQGHHTVFGHRTTLPATAAALVNGMAAHALDFDDNFLPGLTHATATLAPALIAAAESQQVTGRRLIDAYVIGLELQARIGALVNPQHYERGWHATSTIGTIGTAGAVATLLALPPRQIAAAMCIAFSLAGGSKLQFGSEVKPLHAGFAAHNAVLAAHLAAAEVGTHAEFLTGPWSFQDLYCPPPGNNPKDALNDLGQRWAIEEYGLLAKRFPCCAASHKALDAIEMLVRDHRVTLDSLTRVTAFLPTPLHQNLRFDSPRTESEARFSFSYPAARLMQEGHLSLQHFTTDAVMEEVIQKALPLFIREAVQTGPKGVHVPVRVIAEFKSGKNIEIEVSDVQGGPNAPLSKSVLERKIEDCLDWSGTSENAPMFKKMAALHELDDIRKLTRSEKKKDSVGLH
ncbi:MAG: MmgE/PrpD family protein [Sneathiella sp.]